MKIVAGLSIKNFNPRVWDAASPYYIPNLSTVMVSYAEFHRMPARLRQAARVGLHTYLGVPESTCVFLDNGAFYFLGRDGETVFQQYEEFVKQARPDWYPIPRDFIPIPSMTRVEQQHCLSRTMEVNATYRHDGYVPVMHISEVIDEYIAAFVADDRLSRKPAIALGGIVPNLLRRPKARPYREVLASVKRVREKFPEKKLHLFGVGGTATLHIAALLGMDSVDSSGWRNRAARGLIQLEGSGDRMVANLGSWRGREPSPAEWVRLRDCRCPACQQFGLDALKAGGSHGFCARATHNLWTLLNEADLIQKHLADGSYCDWMRGHLDNTTYRPLIMELAADRKGEFVTGERRADRSDSREGPSPIAMGEG